MDKRQFDLMYDGGGCFDDQAKPQQPAAAQTPAAPVAAAESLPAAPQKFDLPEDLETLAAMRDQLGDYLAVLERNTDTVNDWLTEKQDEIILANHRLYRAIAVNKNDNQALTILSDMGDITGFVLSLQDFKTMAGETFGVGSELYKKLNVSLPIMPAHLLEELPVVEKPDNTKKTAFLQKEATPEQIDAVAAPEAKKKGGFFSFNWLKRDKSDKKKEESAEDIARRKEEENRRKWIQVRSELISLQSERHYYIDSIFEQIGEKLAPSGKYTKSEIAALADKYQDPQYVIDRAAEDYQTALTGRTEILRARASEYSSMAGALDRKEAKQAAKVIGDLFKDKGSPRSEKLRSLLLKDFDKESFADFAMTYITNRDDQFTLLEQALKNEKTFKLRKYKNREQLFNYILDEVTAPQSPLNIKALGMTMDSIRAAEDEDFDKIILTSDAFEKIYDRFKSDDVALNVAVGTLMKAMPGLAGKENNFLDLCAALKNGSVTELQTCLNTVRDQKSSLELGAIWSLCRPYDVISDKILFEAYKTPEEKMTIVNLAVTAGVMPEFIMGATADSSVKNVISFLQSNLVDAIARDGRDMLSVMDHSRALIAQCFANGGLDALRDAVTDKWIPQIADSQAISDDVKVKWISAMVEPFAMPAMKANILISASEVAQQASGKALLQDLEHHFIGKNIRLGMNSLLMNNDEISDIWYNSEEKNIQVAGQGSAIYQAVSGASKTQAEEWFGVIARRGDFEAEGAGLFHPENFDLFISKNQKTNGRVGLLNIPLHLSEQSFEKAHGSDGFVHFKKNAQEVLSFNQKAICYIDQNGPDQYVVITKNGAIIDVDGAIEVQKCDKLVSLSQGKYSMINVDNASLISINENDRSIGFRVESDNFDAIIKNKKTDSNYILPVAVTDQAAFAKIRAQLSGNPSAVSPGKQLDHLYFNFSALRYMNVSLGGVAGYKCQRQVSEWQKQSSANKNNFIKVDDVLMKSMFDGLQDKAGIFNYGSLLTHEDCIRSAHYGTDGVLSLALGTDPGFSFRCEPDIAYNLLENLSQRKGWLTAGEHKTMDGQKYPAHVIDMRKTCMLDYNPSSQVMSICQPEGMVGLALDAPRAYKMLALAEEYVFDYQRNNRLKNTLAALPAITVSRTPVLADASKKYLLSLLQNGASKKETKVPDVMADFSLAAASEKTFTYPVPESAPAKKKEKGPKP